MRTARFEPMHHAGFSDQHVIGSRSCSASSIHSDNAAYRAECQAVCVNGFFAAALVTSKNSAKRGNDMSVQWR